MVRGWIEQARRNRRDARERAAQFRIDQRLAEWQRIASGGRSLITVRSRNGLLTFDSRDSVIGQTLYRFGHWEYDLIVRTTELLRAHGLVDPRRKTLVDAGAHIGSTTIAFLNDRVFERAVSVEPDPFNFSLLQRNVEQNQLQDRVRSVPVALGAFTGESLLELSPDNYGDHRVQITAASGAYGEEQRDTRTVKVERLDEILNRDDGFGLATVGLLWIDVQGFEGHILQGAPGLLAQGVPVELEFWPYGLERAGTSQGTFLRLLAASFTHFIDLRDPAVRVRPIGEVEDLYAGYVGPFADTELLAFHS